MNPVKSISWLLLAIFPHLLPAAEFWVSTAGRADAAGTRDDPWRIETALAGSPPLGPGSTVWFEEGIYRCPDRSPNASFQLLRHRGEPGRPIVFRPVPGARVVLDGGLTVGSDSAADSPAHVWVRDLEITVSEKNRRTEQTGSWPTDLGAPFGGVTLRASQSCKLINLVIHDNPGGGLNLWTPAIDAEVYGCLVSNNGWSAPDRGHGHGIYAQNREGWKTVRHCILTVPSDRGDQLAQFYGSDQAHLDRFRVVENIAYGDGRHTRLLLGGGTVSRQHHVLGNAIHFATLQLGYAARGNTGGEVIDNIVSRGALRLIHYDDCVVRENLVVGDTLQTTECRATIDPSANEIRRTPDTFPAEPRIVAFPNAYDPSRVHLAVFNWSRRARIAVPVAGFLEPGDGYRLRNPADFHGEAVFSGICTGPALDLPFDREFGAFVLEKTAPTAPVPENR